MDQKRVRVVYYAALFVSVGFSVAGQLLMKWAALRSVGSLSLISDLPRMTLALSIYSFGIVSWIFALRHIRLSVAYSVASLNYVGILFGSYYCLGEKVSLLQVIGMLLILTGVSLVVSRPATAVRSASVQTLNVSSSRETS